MTQLAAAERSHLERFGFINALRGFAFMMVLLVHCANTISGLPPKFDALVGQGARGVQLFFLISAFTLVHSMASREGREPSLILNFFVRRLFRIAPLFWVAIWIWLWIDGPSGPRYWAPRGVSPSGITLTFFFLNGWHPETLTAIVPGGWSIAVEMMFYVLLPFLYKTIRNLESSLWLVLGSLLGGSLISTVLNKLVHPLFPSEMGYVLDSFFSLWLPMQLHVFALGFVLYFLLKQQSIIGRGPANPRALRSQAWLLLLAATYLLVGSAFGRLTLIPGFLLYGIAFLFLSWSLALRPLPILVNRFTNHVGIVSFSAYVIHFLVLHAITTLSPTLPFLREILCTNSNPLLQLLVLYVFAFFTTLTLSTLTWKLIEEPGIALGGFVIRALNKARGHAKA
ncbi:MAG: acyltransferase [Verrucomicrobia bacterium]|nr:acyltransferase [Verrucomicrobiota bacterium]